MDTEKKSNGALVGLVIIVIILVIGGIYMWQTSKSTINPSDTSPTQNDTVTSEDSASLDNLEQDLQTTDTDVGIDVDTIN